MSLLIVVTAFFFAEYRNIKTKKASYNAILSANTETLSPELQNEDSDNDGLKDWEEILLGTDPRNSDTDGDETTDGKEADLGRNPLVKGPKDSTKITSSNSTAIENDLTPTDKLARDFFARYMELRQVGLSQDKQSQQELVGQVLKSGIVLAVPKTYELKYMLVIPDDSKEAVKKYGNDVGAVFKKYINSNTKNEMVIAKESVDKEDPNLLKEIDPIISIYKNILTELLKIKTPKSLNENHIDMINSISTLKFSAESLRKIDTDALAGVQGTSIWLGAATILNKTFNTIKNSFSTNGITYTTNESGSFFMLQQ